MLGVRDWDSLRVLLGSVDFPLPYSPLQDPGPPSPPLIFIPLQVFCHKHLSISTSFPSITYFPQYYLGHLLSWPTLRLCSSPSSHVSLSLPMSTFELPANHYPTGLTSKTAFWKATSIWCFRTSPGCRPFCYWPHPWRSRSPSCLHFFFPCFIFLP